MKQPIAILCSDIHLCHKPPVARSAESDWYEAMHRTLAEVLELVEDNGCPLIIAGDIFDRWNSPPELINFAIEAFSSYENSIYAIPGQHDLPNHRMDQIKRSAYWSLVLSGYLDSFEFRVEHFSETHKLSMVGFPWGIDVNPSERKKSDNETRLAVVHSYIWKRGHSYPGADPNQKVAKYHDNLKGYDAAAFGDNHKGFIVNTPNLNLINCGTLMRRKIDEIDYKPQVGLLYKGGKIEPHYLDTSEDKFIDVDSNVELDQLKVGENLIEELKHLEVDSLDFRETVIRNMDVAGVSQNVREIVLESIE